MRFKGMPLPRECPCHSGLRYAACCEPYISGAQIAPTPAALMRSRYAAFALGRIAYLRKTLVAGHPDGQPDGPLLQDLAKMKYLGLRIVESSEDGDRGEVLFVTRIFERGVDRSFAELSRFAKQGDPADANAPKTWRYEDGDLLPGSMVKKSVLASLTRESFLAARANLMKAV